MTDEGSSPIRKVFLRQSKGTLRKAGLEGAPYVCLADQIPLELSRISPRHFAYPRMTLEELLGSGATGFHVSTPLKPRLRGLFTLRQRAARDALDLEGRMIAATSEERSDVLAMALALAENYVVTLNDLFESSVLEDLARTAGIPVIMSARLENLSIVVFNDWTYFIKHIEDT